MVNKRILVIFSCMFFFFYTLNYLTPMAFGDDYVYSFIWEGHSLYEPLSENAVRISSLKDLFASQLLHYYTWSGRVINHSLEQFFLWKGKGVFNICNAFVSTFLVAEVYWLSNKGIVNMQMSVAKFFGIFLALWAFSPKYSDVFLWLVGACNYLWPIIILIGFLLPYIRKYYFVLDKTHKSSVFCLGMFFLGLMAGCTNENTICFVIPILMLFVFREWKSGRSESWLYFGLTGLMVGYAVLMFAPGNLVRLLAEKNSYHWLSWKSLMGNVALLFLILIYFQIFLWYFNLRSLYSLRERIEKNIGMGKDILLVKIMCTVSFCMTFMMVFSPSFPPRSAFPGSILLIIAACILLRIQEEYKITLIKESAKKFLYAIGIIYFVITAATTFYGSYYTKEQIKDFLAFINSSNYAKGNIIEIDLLSPVGDMVRKASWFHLMKIEMSNNEKDWRNVAFSRYYGIKGIRVVKKDAESNE